MEITSTKIEILPENPNREPLTIKNTGGNNLKVIYSDTTGAGGKPLYSNVPAGGQVDLDGGYLGKIEAVSKDGTTLEIVEGE